MGHIDDQVDAADFYARGLAQGAGQTEARHVSGEQKIALGLGPAERFSGPQFGEIAAHQLLRRTRVATHDNVANRSLDDPNLDNAVLDALGGHQSAGRDIFLAAVFGLDPVGDVSQGLKIDLLPQELGVKRLKLRRIENRGAVDLQLVQREGDGGRFGGKLGARRRLQFRPFAQFRPHKLSSPLNQRRSSSIPLPTTGANAATPV